MQPDTDDIIVSLQKQWRLQAIVANVIWALAATIVIFAVANIFYQMRIWWLLPLLGLAVVAIFLLKKNWAITIPDVLVYLNKSLPQLQESAALLQKPIAELNFLERLQLAKVSEAMQQAQVPRPLGPQLLTAGGWLLAAMAVSLLLAMLPTANNSGAISTKAALSAIFSESDKLPAAVKFANILVVPPAYTGKASRRQSNFNLQVLQGSQVKWTITTGSRAAKLQLVFNNKNIVRFAASSQDSTTWMAQARVDSAGFYKVVVEGRTSELYVLEVTPDKPPMANIVLPKSGTIIETGRPPQVMLTGIISDDYGLANAWLSATVASGSGEGVSFKEQKLLIKNYNKGAGKVAMQQLLQLPALGMKPGDELYMYAQVIDALGQKTKSDVVVVTLQDTAGLMTMDGLVNALDLKPAFFRSQRQIIIETEQLLKDKGRLTVQEYNAKSNDLGIDQKLLRLRYGKFLGEENSIEIGEGHNEHDEPAGHDDHDEGPTKFGDANAILDQFSHKHDIAEDATFFDPETKKQLKATLAEMWKAEGRLRLYEPAAALPFEYKALKLLKDLQQQSRMYVAKTAIKTAPLKPNEKRLTGELDKIGQPLLKSDIKPANNNLPLRRLLAALATTNPVKIDAGTLALLQQAGTMLSQQATAQPALYLPAFRAYQQLLKGAGSYAGIKVLQKALQQMLPQPALQPYQTTMPNAANLPGLYFNNLQKQGQ